MTNTKYTKIEMTNGQSFNMSHSTRSNENLKSNHRIMIGINGIKYVVNICNNFAYKCNSLNN
jgi:hypothetical protein